MRVAWRKRKRRKGKGEGRVLGVVEVCESRDASQVVAGSALSHSMSGISGIGERSWFVCTTLIFDLLVDDDISEYFRD